MRLALIACAIWGLMIATFCVLDELRNIRAELQGARVIHTNQQ
ncbi:hypothetical protein [Bradyrhizobium sp. S3.7.6]